MTEQLTREQILTADPAQLNEWIDDYIMNDRDKWLPPENWAQDISAAWEIVEKMRLYTFDLFRSDGRKPSEEWVCIFSSGMGMETKSSRVYAPTAELAISKCALLAVMGL